MMAFMDNTMQAASAWAQYNGNYPDFPGKIRHFNLFEPFMHIGIREYFQQLDSSMFLVNQTVNDEIDLIRLATAADFLWNAASYSPDYSLWKVLTSRYSPEAAREIIIYADKFSMMLETLVRLHKNEQPGRNLKNGQAILEELTYQVQLIGNLLGEEHPLLQALKKHNDLLNRRFEEYTKTTRPQP
jgi:hypothetical protein